MEPLRRTLVAVALCAALAGPLAACSPPASPAETLARIYQDVPQAQQDRLQAFRASHPFKEVTVDGTAWRYIACGQGEETIFLLPGVSRSAEAQFVLISMLEPDYRIIAPNYAPLMTTAGLADGLAWVLDAEGVERVAVYGVSFGGMVAQRFVRQYPERASKLVLANSGITQLPALALKAIGLMAHLPPPLPRLIMKQVTCGVIAAPPDEEAFWRAYYEELFALHVSNADAAACVADGADAVLDSHSFTAQDLAAWPGQVLILESDQDQGFSPAERAALRALYPQAQVHTFYQGGYTPWLTARDEYVGAIRAFLAAPL